MKSRFVIIFSRNGKKYLITNDTEVLGYFGELRERRFESSDFYNNKQFMSVYSRPDNQRVIKFADFKSILTVFRLMTILENHGIKYDITFKNN